MNKIQFVAEQLRAMAPDREWIQGHDRSIELAQMFVRAGITDLWALKLIPVTKIIRHEGQLVGAESGDVWHPPWDETVQTFAFDYYGRQIGFLGTPTRQDNADVLEKSEIGYLIAWSAEGRGHMGYVVAPDQKTRALRILPIWGSSSEAAELRGVVLTALSFFAMTLPLAGVSLGAVIGNAVLPASVATAYPALASIVGNVALSTALNGGDVGSAVKSAIVSGASGFAGAEVGGFAATAANSQFFGDVVNVATRAALAGGNVKTAVAGELLSKGVTGMSADDNVIFQSLTGGIGTEPNFYFDPNTGQVSTNWWENNDWFEVSPTEPIDFSLPAIEYEIPELPPVDIPIITIDPAQPALDPVTWNPFQPVGSVFNPGLSAVVPQGTPPPSSPSFNASNVVQGLTSAAMSVISLIRAYRSLETPAVQTTARVVRPNGAVSVIGNNGMIQTRNPDGTVSASVPPVGVPQATLDGNYVVNNGDGTYTVVSPQGQSQTLPYNSAANANTGSIIQGIPNALLVIGGVLLLAKKG